MPLVIVLCIVFVLLVFTWWAIAHEPGPRPADVALAYEHAWDELNFSLLYDLSGDELRDGMRRDQFVAAKRAAYADTHQAGRLATSIELDTIIDSTQTALAVTRVTTSHGSIRNNVVMERVAGGWAVVEYSLRPDDAGSKLPPP